MTGIKSKLINKNKINCVGIRVPFVKSICVTVCAYPLKRNRVRKTPWDFTNVSFIWPAAQIHDQGPILDISADA